MGRDESATLARLKGLRRELFEPALARNGGRLVKVAGDGALAEFVSAGDALRAAIEFQQAVADANIDQPEATRIVFRIGLLSSFLCPSSTWITRMSTFCSSRWVAKLCRSVWRETRLSMPAA